MGLPGKLLLSIKESSFNSKRILASLQLSAGSLRYIAVKILKTNNSIK